MRKLRKITSLILTTGILTPAILSVSSCSVGGGGDKPGPKPTPTPRNDRISYAGSNAYPVDMDIKSAHIQFDYDGEEGTEINVESIKLSRDDEHELIWQDEPIIVKNGIFVFSVQFERQMKFNWEQYFNVTFSYANGSSQRVTQEIDTEFRIYTDIKPKTNDVSLSGDTFYFSPPSETQTTFDLDFIFVDDISPYHGDECRYDLQFTVFNVESSQGQLDADVELAEKWVDNKICTKTFKITSKNQSEIVTGDNVSFDVKVSYYDTALEYFIIKNTTLHATLICGEQP